MPEFLEMPQIKKPFQHSERFLSKAEGICVLLRQNIFLSDQEFRIQQRASRGAADGVVR
jgi:hypothetical protein